MKSGRNSKISEATTPADVPPAKLSLKELEALDSDELEEDQRKERDKLRYAKK